MENTDIHLLKFLLLPLGYIQQTHTPLHLFQIKPKSPLHNHTQIFDHPLSSPTYTTTLDQMIPAPSRPPSFSRMEKKTGVTTDVDAGGGSSLEYSQQPPFLVG
ncbi:hypothetical protein Hanom_Chr05g00415051 [Helianthus anomalus]